MSGQDLVTSHHRAYTLKSTILTNIICLSLTSLRCSYFHFFDRQPCVLSSRYPPCAVGSPGHSVLSTAILRPVRGGCSDGRRTAVATASTATRESIDTRVIGSAGWCCGIGQTRRRPREVSGQWQTVLGRLGRSTAPHWWQISVLAAFVRLCRKYRRPILV